MCRLLQSGYAEPVNIGNPHEMTILQFANRVRELFGNASPIVFRPLPTDDPKVRRPDITRAREVLGWEPKVDFADGLRTTVEWFRGQLAPDAAARDVGGVAAGKA